MSVSIRDHELEPLKNMLKVDKVTHKGRHIHVYLDNFFGKENWPVFRKIQRMEHFEVHQVDFDNMVIILRESR